MLCTLILNVLYQINWVYQISRQIIPSTCLFFIIILILLKCQKVIEEFQAEGEPVLEMSTLTEDGVMNVKTEVNKELITLTLRVASNFRSLSSRKCICKMKISVGLYIAGKNIIIIDLDNFPLLSCTYKN